MAKRRKKTVAKKTKKKASKRVAKAAASPSFVQVAERAVIAQSNKMLVAATKQYKKLVRQAAKATNDKHKRQYLAAALSAVAIAGVIANDLKKRINARPARAASRKKRL
jgi:hypothetical protein